MFFMIALDVPVNVFHVRGWIKKFLKLFAYLCEYTMESYKTYTEYGTNIS